MDGSKEKDQLEARKLAVAEMLHKALPLADKSPAEVARETGVSKATMSRILSAQTLAEPDTLRALSHCLPISYDELMHAAGYIEANRGNDVLVDRFNSFPADLRRELIQYGLFRLRRQEGFESAMNEHAVSRELQYA